MTPTLKTVSTIGWICFGIDALLVVSFFITQNVGDDAAGRGMATGFAIVLTPILLLAGGILYWATRSGSRAGIIGGTLFTALPFIALAVGRLNQVVDRFGRSAAMARRGKFKDPALTRVAAAVLVGDTIAVDTLLKGTAVDFTQRDTFDHTLLGVAVDQATDLMRGPKHPEMVGFLLAHGVPYATDATEVNGDWFATIVGDTGDRYNDVLEAALKHGANPNTKARYDDFPLLFSLNMTVAKAELLLKYGANLQGRSERTDRPRWTALMNAAYMGQWDLASFFLQRGVPVQYKAPDGNDVFSVMADVASRTKASAGTLDPGYDSLMSAINAAKAKR
ncbi:MAG: ankyrin repeat domain-containing protein [Gemmatimonadaceae bacterium]